MTRGDQRERDRAKNLKALAATKDKKTGSVQQRREADAKALADKIAAKAAAAAAAGGATGAAGAGTGAGAAKGPKDKVAPVKK